MTSPIDRIRSWHPELTGIRRDIHAHPELSFQEQRTSGIVADYLRNLGIETHTGLAKTGVVGVVPGRDNGPKGIALRADMDCLPIEEGNTFEHRSRNAGRMHACGHDGHTTMLLGAARYLAETRNFAGTAYLVFQPAEEGGGGGEVMVREGLFERFPASEVYALHNWPGLPPGKVSVRSGPTMAAFDIFEVVIQGKGTHGAMPHLGIDPVVVAAEIVLALQTIASRQLDVTKAPSVITIGMIHGGVRENIIPDEVHLQLTLRSYTDEVRQQTIAAVKRITRGLAIAAGMPEDRMPIVTLSDDFTPATYNDPELTGRLAGVVKNWFGAAMVIRKKPVMGGEDFSEYGRTEHKIPICMFTIGVVSEEAMKESARTGESLPSLHSPLFAPVPEPTLKTGVTAMTAAVLELMGRK